MLWIELGVICLPSMCWPAEFHLRCLQPSIWTSTILTVRNVECLGFGFHLVWILQTKNSTWTWDYRLVWIFIYYQTNAHPFLWFFKPMLEELNDGRVKEKKFISLVLLLIVQEVKFGVWRIVHEALGLRCKCLLGRLLWTIEFLSKVIPCPLIVYDVYKAGKNTTNHTNSPGENQEDEENDFSFI